MMKFMFKGFLSVEKDACDCLLSLMLLPLFITATTLYSALFAVIFSVLLLGFNICISLLFGKFNADIRIMPIAVLLNGAISIIVSTVAQNLVANSFDLCFSALIFSILMFIRYEKSAEEELSAGIISVLKYLSVTVASVLVVAIIREILASGRILLGFTENGVQLFSHKFGEYINTPAGLLLILSVAMFIATLVFRDKDFLPIKKGSAKIILFSLVLSLVFSLAAFGLGKLFAMINAPMLALIVIFAFAAGNMYLLALVFDKETSDIISIFALMFTIYIYLCTDSFLTLFFIYAALFIAVMISAICAELIYINDHSKKLAAPAILLICSLVAMIYDKII